MRRAFTLLVCCTVISFAPGQEKQKDQKELSPSEVVQAWNGALAKADMKTVRNLSVKNTREEIFEALHQHALIWKHSKDKVAAKIIHEEISGDAAVVVYRVQHGSEITYDVVKLVREDQAWKVSGEAGRVFLKKGG
jgi:hypothetical protein